MMQGGPQCPSQRVYPQRGQEARNEDLTAIRGDLGTLIKIHKESIMSWGT
jgi:hypothetical protein